MKVENPTVEEVKAWAYSDSEWPHSEWDLFLSWTREIDLFIELAMDHKCPKRNFFLHMLYYSVGKIYKNENNLDQLALIKSYADKSIGIKHGDIKAWRMNLVDLLKGHLEYNYEDWNCGKLANYKFT